MIKKFLLCTAAAALTAWGVTASTTITIPASSGSGDAVTTGTLAQFAATTSSQLKGVLSDENAPDGASSKFILALGSLSIASGKTATVSNTLTLAGTDSTTMTFPSTSATIARTDAANTFTGTQTIGALVATTFNGNTWGTGTGTLSIAAGKTLTSSKTLTLDGTDSTTMTFPSTSATIARTDAANTFTGVQTMTSPAITGGTHTAITGLGIRSTGAAFDLTLASSEVLTAGRTLSISMGDAARTLTLSGSPTLSGITTTGTGTLAMGTKNLTLSNTLTLAGTDSTVMTFPSTSATIARTDAANTFTGVQTMTSPVFTTPVLGTPSSGTLSSCDAATDSVAGVMSAADHTTLTALSTAPATGVAPTAATGVMWVSQKTGVDLKTNAVTDLFTVPASKNAVIVGAYVVPTAVTGGAAVTFTFKIQESGANGTMGQANAAGSSAPLTTKFWNQSSLAAASTPLVICAATNKVQVSITTGFTTSTTVTGTVYVIGFYVP